MPEFSVFKEHFFCSNRTEKSFGIFPKDYGSLLMMTGWTFADFLRGRQSWDIKFLYWLNLFPPDTNIYHVVLVSGKKQYFTLWGFLTLCLPKSKFLSLSLGLIRSALRGQALEGVRLESGPIFPSAKDSVYHPGAFSASRQIPLWVFSQMYRWKPKSLPTTFQANSLDQVAGTSLRCRDIGLFLCVRGTASARISASRNYWICFMLSFFRQPFHPQTRVRSLNCFLVFKEHLRGLFALYLLFGDQQNVYGYMRITKFDRVPSFCQGIIFRRCTYAPFKKRSFFHY